MELNTAIEKQEKEIYQKATKSRVYEAEKNIIHVRTAIILFNTAFYFLFIDKKYCIEWLAVSVIIASIAYSLFIEIAKPYQRFPILLTGYFTSISDCIVISLWILATGGFHSPFYLLWYISIFAVSFRFNALTTTLSASLYCICYLVAISLANNTELQVITPDLVLRLAYIFFAGTIGILITRENFSQTQQRMKVETLSKQLNEANEKVLSQAALYKNMMQAQSELGEAIVLVTENRIVYVNEALCNLTGYTSEELISKRSVLNLIANEDRPRIKELEIKRWKGLNVESYIETKLERKNGEEVSVGYSSQVFEIQGERSLFYILRDITNQKSKDRLLEEKTKDLINQNEELEQFAYFASHDLLEPLRMVNSFLTLLEKKYETQLDETALQYIRFATDGAIRMRKTILDLLEFSRVGKLKDALEPINFNALLEEIVQNCRNSILESGAEVHWANLPNIYGRKTHVRLILQNLIENALKYRREGVPPRIQIRVQETRTHFQISVADNGIGIDEKYFDRIFILFQRLHGKDEYSGTGVGLSICKKIAEMHQGKIWVSSKIGQGSIFYFTIIKGVSLNEGLKRTI